MKRKNSSLNELLNNVSSLVKYRSGIAKPPRKNRGTTLALVSIVSGAALGLAGGLLFARESGQDTRKKIGRAFKDASKRTSEYTTREINRLNEMTKQQIEKLKNAKREKVG